MRYNWLDWLALIILVIGGLNWLLVGAFEYDLVADLFGEMSTFTRFVYVLVGVSAIYALFAFPTKGER